MATEGPVIICSAMPCEGYSAYHLKLLVPYEVVEACFASPLLEGPLAKLDWLFAAPCSERNYRSEIIFRCKHLLAQYKIKTIVLKWLSVPYDDRLIPWVRIARKPAQYALDWKDEKDNKEHPYIMRGKEPHKRPFSYYKQKVADQVKILSLFDAGDADAAVNMLMLFRKKHPMFHETPAWGKFQEKLELHGYASYHDGMILKKGSEAHLARIQDLEETETEN